MFLRQESLKRPVPYPDRGTLSTYVWPQGERGAPDSGAKVRHRPDSDGQRLSISTVSPVTSDIMGFEKLESTNLCCTEKGKKISSKKKTKSH